MTPELDRPPICENCEHCETIVIDGAFLDARTFTVCTCDTSEDYNDVINPKQCGCEEFNYKEVG